MSLESWKEEFMPIEAKEAAADGLGPAIAHSLQSWIGMRAENAGRHGLYVDGLRLFGDGASMVKSVDECALCQLFFDQHCKGCPLLRDGWEKCFRDGRGYKIMTKTSNPEVMIQELEEAMEEWKRENGEVK